MENLDILRRYGLFDTKVPRYTSYPPANRFEIGTGQRHQAYWLAQTPVDKPVSVYIHIPFCRRLCWFCACRTQGTQTLGPIESYIDTLIKELQAVKKTLQTAPPMARLHLGGGTPTLLTAAQMKRLLAAVFEVFQATDSFEFSVEIDPTEASFEVLEELQKWGMNRASIGVQDFDETVQKAIGRLQSFEQTAHVVDQIRTLGVPSLNFDLLYGLPHQTMERLVNTLDKALELKPDRLALYGYAHVPHASKRQVMIDVDALPSTQTRYQMAKTATQHLLAHGLHKLGIDHFAKPEDSLFTAADQGNLRRNFQGYTDDTCDTLIGFGASAISKFPGGYCQNAVATAAYTQRVEDAGLAGHKGYVMHDADIVIASMIETLMCDFEIDSGAIDAQFPNLPSCKPYLDAVAKQFPDALDRNAGRIKLIPAFEPLARIIAATLDAQAVEQNHHSVAI